MHMSDALLSPAVAAVTGAIAISLITIAIRRVGQDSADENSRHRRSLLPLMGIMGAFVFAAQMINFTIPATGSSGHLIGGILLAAMLGPWAGFLTLTAVLIIQCLIFADGGFLALGCNIINMAAISCLVVYPMIFRGLMHHDASIRRIALASIISSIIALFLGAVAVTLETTLSGVTLLPMRRFLVYMVAIHLAVGLGEGIATTAVLAVVKHYRPDLIIDLKPKQRHRHNTARVLAMFAIAALLIGASFSWIASSRPDGLEWSIMQVSDGEELTLPDTPYHVAAERVVEQTALMPDYNTSMAGILGSGAIILVVFIFTWVFRQRNRT